MEVKVGLYVVFAKVYWNFIALSKCKNKKLILDRGLKEALTENFGGKQSIQVYFINCKIQYHICAC